MIQLERHKKIIQILEREQFITIRKLSKELFCSESSLRRDIQVLEKSGIVTHIHGGIMLTKFQNSVVPIEYRNSENSANKEIIAQKAAKLVCSGNTVLMDASSTTRRIAKYLSNLKNVKIITNNHRLFDEINDPNIKMYCTGGTYNPANHCFVGPAAEAYVRSVYADIVFFSSQGISADGDISDVSEEETSLRRTMLLRAKRRVFLCDSSKIGIQKIFLLCNRSEVQDIICENDTCFE